MGAGVITWISAALNGSRVQSTPPQHNLILEQRDLSRNAKHAPQPPPMMPVMVMMKVPFSQYKLKSLIYCDTNVLIFHFDVIRFICVLIRLNVSYDIEDIRIGGVL